MRDIKEMARQVKMPYDFVTGEPINIEKLESFAELVSADALAARTAKPARYDKTELNCFAYRLYEKKMREGKLGHYKSMSYVIHQCIKKVASPPAQPTVPDALTIADKNSADYHEGWNDCRALMLEMRKP